MSEPLTMKDLLAIRDKLRDVDWSNMLTPEETAFTWQVPPEDTPDRHQDYLPLNLWDDTPR